MPKGKRKGFKPPARPTSYYKLTEVRQIIAKGRVLIQSNALESALRDFGWETKDILDAYAKLQPRHFYKSDNSKVKHDTVVDVYKATRLNGEDIYTHFYIDDIEQKLVINSFHRI